MVSAFCFLLELSDVSFDPAFGFGVIGEFLLVAFEGGRVVVATTVNVFRRVMNVEHFVEDDVFDHISRRVEGIE